MSGIADDALLVVKRLRAHGYEAYWVGGCVRDILLARTPKDYDVVTNATPDQVALLFERHAAVGKAYGVMLVHENGGPVEVATYRAEQGYADRRRPDAVVWTDAKGDVLRRDFTVNGLLYDPIDREVIDYVGGQRDLEIGIIRCIGNPPERLREDPLRILRAVRLKNALGFQYDQTTYRALVAQAGGIGHIAQERIGAELELMLADASREQAVRDLERLGVLRLIVPEVEAAKGTPQPRQYHQEGDVYDHLLRSLGAVPPAAPAFLAWAALLHDIAKPLTLRYPPPGHPGRITSYGHAAQSAAVAARILSRLRRPSTEIETVRWLIANHMSLAHLERLRPHKREAFLLDPRFPWLLELHHADAAGAVPVDLSLYEDALKQYQAFKAEHARTLRATPQPLINGHDLLEAGIPAGPVIATLLAAVRDGQLQGTITSKSAAVALAKRMVGPGYGSAEA